VSFRRKVSLIDSFGCDEKPTLMMSISSWLLPDSKVGDGETYKHTVKSKHFNECAVTEHYKMLQVYVKSTIKE